MVRRVKTAKGVALLVLSTCNLLVTTLTLGPSKFGDNKYNFFSFFFSFFLGFFWRKGESDEVAARSYQGRRGLQVRTLLHKAILIVACVLYCHLTLRFAILSSCHRACSIQHP